MSMQIRQIYYPASEKRFREHECAIRLTIDLQLLRDTILFEILISHRDMLGSDSHFYFLYLYQLDLRS